LNPAPFCRVWIVRSNKEILERLLALNLTQVAALKCSPAVRPLFAANCTNFHGFEKKSVKISEFRGKVFWGVDMVIT
jgi:hypothetical protein